MLLVQDDFVSSKSGLKAKTNLLKLLQGKCLFLFCICSSFHIMRTNQFSLSEEDSKSSAAVYSSCTWLGAWRGSILGIHHCPCRIRLFVGDENLFMPTTIK